MSYRTWIGHLDQDGVASDLSPDSVKPDSMKPPPEMPGPYITVPKGEFSGVQPSDLIEKLKKRESKEQQQLNKIENLIKHHNRIPDAIEIDINRKPATAPKGDTGPVFFLACLACFLSLFTFLFFQIGPAGPAGRETILFLPLTLLSSSPWCCWYSWSTWCSTRAARPTR